MGGGYAAGDIMLRSGYAVGDMSVGGGYAMGDVSFAIGYAFTMGGAHGAEARAPRPLPGRPPLERGEHLLRPPRHAQLPHLHRAVRCRRDACWQQSSGAAQP